MSELVVRPETIHDLEEFEQKGNLLSWVSSCDHKQIGILYMLTALGFFIIAGCEALYIRLQLAVPNNHLLRPTTNYLRCTEPR
jgi:heme/copper-type cytochrome/quinol oxidase subunit 1